MDVWDIFFRLTAPALTHKVSDVGLSCVAVSPQAGRLFACGDKIGSVHLLEVTRQLTKGGLSVSLSLAHYVTCHVPHVCPLFCLHVSMLGIGRSCCPAAVGARGGGRAL